MRGLRHPLLIGAAVVISSEFYFGFSIADFRFSAAAVLFPVLLSAFGEARDACRTGALTALMVFTARFLMDLAGDVSPVEAVSQNLPGAFFYLFYGLLFGLMARDRGCFPTTVWTGISALFCDFLSNLLESVLRIRDFPASREICSTLMLVALIRAFTASLLLGLIRCHQLLLTREEHERRYQRLFLMTTALKNELYFMQKNTEEIEGIMSNAYRLYERLEHESDDRALALAIARDVHEVKKDYIRIMQGMKEELAAAEQQGTMRFQDLLRMLKSYCQRQIEQKGLRITLDFRCGHDFCTRDHYALMSVLKNLVVNAVEAVESGAGQGTILIREEKDGPSYRFTVEDDGPGISARHLDYIFTMGFSTKFDEKTGSIARGVGLPGVKMTVEEQLGGTIGVETRPGLCTRFTILIPAARLEEANE